MQKEYWLGHYQLLKIIASKGQTEIYEGVHHELERRAAIKVLYLKEIKEKRERERAAERFFQEACHLDQWRDHPHIVELYDYGEEKGVVYMVMQYAPYGSLAFRHPLESLLSFDLIRRYAREIGGALQSLHEAGWLHRDVKPGNILLGANNQTLLGDFGLLIEDHSRQSPRGYLEYGGTRVYMAPEQADGEPCPASDQYALATMLFEWLTGSRPFEGPAEQILWQRRYYPAPSLRELAPDIPLEVEQVVLKGLQIAPHHRYDSMREFVQALEDAFDPPLRHAAHVRLPYYAGASRPIKSHVAHRHDTRPGQRVVSRQRVAAREAILCDDGHSSDAPLHAQDEVLYDPQFDESALQPSLSIHEDDFVLEGDDFALVPAGDAGFVRRVWNRLENWVKS